jgi:hypothetical protein
MVSGTDVVKATEEPTELAAEIDCDQIAIGLPPARSAVFLKAKSF